MAKHTDTLAGGFPYPKEMMAFAISKERWAKFCSDLTAPLATKKIPYVIEEILDICTTWDVKYFRPKGFIVRLDMPGEEKYGLEFLDIYHSRLGAIHTDNLTAVAPREAEHTGAIKHKHHVRERRKDRKHLETLREKAFRSTRLMIDPVVVLKDPSLAEQRGWTRWISACKVAHDLAEEAPPKRKDNQPWYGYSPVRMDRWPPSKHLYYDRFRGSALTSGSKKRSFTYVVPDHDSVRISFHHNFF